MTKTILGIFRLRPIGGGCHVLQTKIDGVWATTTPGEKRRFVAGEALERIEVMMGGDDAAVEYLKSRGIV